MKKLLLITEGFPYGTSEQSFIKNEYDELRRRFDVTIISKGTKPLPIQKGYENERIIRTEDKTTLRKLGGALINGDTVKELRRAVSNGGTSDLIYRRLREIAGYADRAAYIKPVIRNAVKLYDIDIIYTFWCTPATLAAIQLKKEFPSLKVVSRFHGFDLFNERRLSGRQPFKTLMAKELDELFFVSKYGRDYFRDNWGREGIVSYLGTNKRRVIDENPDDVVIVSCSSLIPLKRVDLIISALAELPDDVLIKWHHFGDGPCRGELEKQAMEMLGNKSNIEYCFEGFVDNNMLIERYTQIRPWLFVTASSSEGGTPISILEALSMGVPCIGTNVGGIPEIIETDQNGYLISDAGGSKEVAELITLFITLPRDQRTVFRKNAFDTWKTDFDAETKAIEFAKELEKV